MAIRQVVSRSIADGTIATVDIADSAVTTAKTTGLSAGEGFYQGENGSTSQTSKKGDIFRVNESTLNTSVTIAAGDNASCSAFDCISIWNCKSYSQWKSDDYIGDREWHQHYQ